LEKKAEVLQEEAGRDESVMVVLIRRKNTSPAQLRRSGGLAIPDVTCRGKGGRGQFLIYLQTGDSKNGRQSLRRGETEGLGEKIGCGLGRKQKSKKKVTNLTYSIPEKGWTYGRKISCKTLRNRLKTLEKLAEGTTFRQTSTAAISG